ncbi:hypothetical protein [Ornithinimicrobium avium]|uniref:DUF7847 domain-containing protein n=1 Tax=Ornithinimicrobium avium TaxID=2283195 RepID=A0A345NRR9_9MICO|nr:hypothetical protein [Ornithinimicrobium avium]AXH97727.1 hypothetical protein DV701_17865 [Ornithinimicrobium avium]
MSQPPGSDHGGQVPRWTPPPPGPVPGPQAPQQPAPAWQQLPPEQLARLHQPGVVPLRPLTLGDVFGGTLQTMRRNPSATVGTAFLVLAVLLVPSYLASLAVLRVGSLAAEDRYLLSTVVSTLFLALASVALTGMIVHVVGEAVLGDRVGLAQTWHAVRGRLPALLGVLVLMSLVLTVLAVLAVVAALLLGWALSSVGEVAAIVAGVLVMLALLLVVAWVGVRLSLAPAAVVLERVGPWRGLRRAWRLTTGGQGWRVVGITLLAGILTTMFSSMVQFPVTLVLSALGGLDPFGDASLVSPLMVGTDHLVQLVVNAFVVPFTAGVTALLYLDQRIRREGLDSALVQAAQARAAARTR